MPLINYTTRQAFNELYSVGAEGKWGHPNIRAEVRLHYCRGMFWPEGARRYSRYYCELLGMSPTSKVAVVGAGYGFAVEAAQQGHTWAIANYRAGNTPVVELQPPLGHRLSDIQGQHNPLTVTVVNYVTSSELTVDSDGNPIRSWLVRYDLVYAALPDCVAVDDSSYIQASKGSSDRPEIAEWIDVVPSVTLARRLQILDEFASDGVRLNGGGGQRARVTVLDEDGQTNQSRRNIRGHFGLTGQNKLDWAISEGMVESLSDVEVVAASGNMHDYASNVAHTFIPLDQAKFDSNRQDNRLNWKSLADWRVLLPNDYLINGQIGILDIP